MQLMTYPNRTVGRAGWWLLLLGAVVLGSGCHVHSDHYYDDVYYDDPSYRAVFTATSAFGDPLVIAPGDEIAMSLELINTSALYVDSYAAWQNREVRFQVFDVFGHVVYDSWAVVPIGAFEVIYALDPGDRVVFHHSWFGFDDFGWSLPPGEYWLRATLTGSLASGADLPQAGSIPVTVVAPFSG